jgi:hypothetical protein
MDGGQAIGRQRIKGGRRFAREAKEEAMAMKGTVHAIKDMAVSEKDPVKVDPGHYSVDFENDRVRVLRIRYGPGERSIRLTRLKLD